jgi:hypothetical protein
VPPLARVFAAVVQDPKVVLRTPQDQQAFRNHIDRIMEMLANPCVGTRLREPAGAPPGTRQWSRFCRISLDVTHRLVYRWSPRTPLITIEMVGRHTSGADSVYARLRRRYGLPPDDGHTVSDPTSCCGDPPTPLPGDEWRVDGEQLRATLLQLARR